MDFYAEAVKTLEIIVKAVNGNNGNRHSRRQYALPRYQNVKTFNRKIHLSTRRRVIPCNC